MCLWRLQQSSRNNVQPVFLHDNHNEIVQHQLDIVTHFHIFVPVKIDSITTGNTFINPVKILNKGKSLEIVLDARQLNTMIGETKISSPIELMQLILTWIKEPVLQIADMNSENNHLPLDKPSQRSIYYVIAGH